MGGINLLKNLFEEIIIPKQVYEEVIVKGKEHWKNEVLAIEKLIEGGFIKIKSANSVIELENLDKGEKECITLCKELNIPTLLIDEKEGFDACIIFNLTPIRTTSILLVLLDKKIINFNKYNNFLKELLKNGYFIDALTYEKLLKIGKNIAK